MVVNRPTRQTAGRNAPLPHLNGARRAAAPADRRRHAPPPSGSQIAQELRRGHRARGRCDILLPGAPRSAPARHDQHRHFPHRSPARPPRARGASLHSAGRLPRPLVAPLRSKSLGARAFDRVHVRTTRWIAASGGYRGAAALTAPFYSPAPLVEPLVSRVGRDGISLPEATRTASSPRLTRVPRPSSHVRRAANVPGLRSSSPPVVRAAPTA